MLVFYTTADAERLLNAILFNEKAPNVTEEKMRQANLITENIVNNVRALQDCLNSKEIGITPYTLEWI